MDELDRAFDTAPAIEISLQSDDEFVTATLEASPLFTLMAAEGESLEPLLT